MAGRLDGGGRPARLARLRINATWDLETASTTGVLRSLARRSLELTGEAASHTRADANMSMRDALAAGVRDLRRIYQDAGLYTPYIRAQLQELIALNKATFPELFRR